MTYFLGTEFEPPKIKVPRRSGGMPGFGESLSAAFRDASLARDRNFTSTKYRIGVERDLAERAMQIMPQDALAEAMGARRTAITPQFGLDDPRARIAVLEAAREQATANPDLWADIDLSDDWIVAETNARMQADLQDARSVLAASPPATQAVAGFLGEAGAVASDIRNVPFMLFGGGSGSILKAAARGAAINVAAEAVFLPAQFRQAERLNIPDPDVTTQLAFAAVAGGVIDGGVEGLSRAFTYWRGRNTAVPTVPGRSRGEVSDAISRVEDEIVTGGPDLQERIAEIVDVPPQPVPPPGRDPLVPERIETSVLPRVDGEAPPRGGMDDTSLTGMADTAIREAEDLPDWAQSQIAEIEAEVDRLTQTAVGSARYPLLAAMRRAGVKIMIDSPEGQELLAMGITPRTMPGFLVRRAPDRTMGRTDLDNMVASEWEEKFPGIYEGTGTARDADYLDLNGVMDILRREQAGDFDWMHAMAEARSLRDQIGEIGAQARRSAEDVYLSKGRAEDGGLFIDMDAFNERAAIIEYDGGVDRIVAETMAAERMGLTREQVITRALDDYLDARGVGGYLDEIERAELHATAIRHGGDVEALLDRFYEREAAFVRVQDAGDGPIRTDAAQASDLPADAGRTVRPDADAQPEGGGGARDADDRGFERTPAGEQGVIPGVAPVTDRQRLEARQAAPMRGGDRPMDAGLFDTGARAQTDMFDDPGGKAAAPLRQQAGQDIRDAIATDGDFMVDMGDGKGARTASSVMDELDRMDEFAEILALCGKPRGDA